MVNKDYSPFMVKYSAFSPYRLMRKELGYPQPIGSGDALARSLYCGMKPIASWDTEQTNLLPTGGVFNLEFSPEGSLLVAACEKKSIQIFDPLLHKRILSVDNAHTDCVNCVKFLDARMFATCSDDTTIAIWDVRHLKKKIRNLLGHSNWVKNIEFSVKDKLLVTSGLDGSIYTWDINSYTECNLVYQRVFHASGLMRCRLTPDARKMIMCTTGGLLVIIHDLNLSTLTHDLHGFKPNLYRLMQMSRQLIPIAAMYDHLFDANRKENRVEFVSDFPEGNDAEVVSALQIHPHGWSALSRNISHDDRSEWTCVHDIQPIGPESEKSCRDSSASAEARVRRRGMRRRPRPYGARNAPTPPLPTAAAVAAAVAAAAATPPAAPARPLHVSAPLAAPSASSTSRDRAREGAAAEGGGAPRRDPPPPAPRAAAHAPNIQSDLWEASITIRQHRMLQELYSRGQVGNFNMQRIMGVSTGIAPPAVLRAPMRVQRLVPQRGAGAAAGPLLPALATATATATATAGLATEQPGRTFPSTSGQTPSSRAAALDAELADTSHYIRQNYDRLLYYIEETNEGKGFIKELSYSADGRLICSPFGRGMRLLALTPDCSELSAVGPVNGSPRPLRAVGQSLGVHQDLVVSSKFSPRHHILVTGCLEGKIVWHEPYSGETLY